MGSLGILIAAGLKEGKGLRAERGQLVRVNKARALLLLGLNFSYHIIR